MTFAAEIYVDSTGSIYGASETDQAYTHATTRTKSGRVLAYAGKWFGSQMGYRPFKAAVASAAKAAAEMEHAQ